jgi:transposase InsO family protein
MLEDAMSWFGGSVWSQRLEFCRLAGSGSDVSFTALCDRFGISRKTGYKWLDRFEVEGADGLRDRSRVPKTSPTRTSLRIEAKVLKVRKKHPVWGGRKIRRRLIDLGYIDVPAASTITDILRRHGKLVPAPSQAGGYTLFEAKNPNDMWQSDFKGWIMTGTGRCDPFDILDDHSRYNLKLEAGKDQTTTTVKGYLVETFETYGMPKRMLYDNGTPWGTSQAGFRWTTLTVWLVDLGVAVSHSRPRHPQTLGKDERFHRTLGLEVISRRPVWDSHQQLQRAFDEWRIVYNHQRPHDALDLDVPADRYKPSPRSMPTTIEPVDYPDGYDVRKVSGDARISYRGNPFKIGKPFIGRHIGIVPTTTDGILEIRYRHHFIRNIDLTP